MGRPAITVKYAFAPLAALMGMTEYGAAKALGMDDSAYCGYKRNGMSELVADRYAVRAGLLPQEVWGDAWYEGATKACAARGCDVRFVPYRSNQKWCSPRCSKRERERRRYHRDPEFAKAENERSRKYHADCAEAVRAQSRRRWHARKVA